MKLKRFAGAAAALWLSVCLFAACTDASSSQQSNEDSSSLSVSDAGEDSLEQSSSLEQSEGESSQDESSLIEDDSSSANEDESSLEEKQPSDITPAMWTVTSSDGVSMTLMGSMHALKDEDYPLPDKIMDAYNSADILAVECDVTLTQSFSYQLSLMNEMYYDEGDSLKNHISKEAYEALSLYVKDAGMDISLFDSYKPWAVSSTVDSFSLSAADLKSDNGIDNFFLKTAHEEDKEIYEVESVDFQMDLLMNFSDEIYEAMFLGYEGETVESQGKLMEQLYQAWRQGDLDTIQSLSNDTDTEGLTEEEIKIVEDYNDQMLYDRNINMEQAIKDLLDEGKNVFYIVGAAHFTGEGGIIDLLEKDGYEVERVEY